MNHIDFRDLAKYSHIPDLLKDPTNIIRKRNRIDLLREFENETWKVYLDKFLASNFETYEDFHSNIYSDSTKKAFFDGNAFRISSPLQIQRELQNSISGCVKPIVVKNDSVIELGAGYGAQLVNLKKNLFDLNIHLTCAELTNSGRQLSQVLSKKFNLGIETINVDLEKPGSLESMKIKSAVVFTAFALMYVNINFEDTLRKLLSLGPKYVVFMEPLFEDFEENTTWGVNCREWMKINDYNCNLKSQIFRTVEDFPSFEIIKHHSLVFGSNPFLPFSLLVIANYDIQF